MKFDPIYLHLYSASTSQATLPGLSWGGLGLRRDSSFRGGGVLFNHAFVERDSGWRLSSFRGEGFGLS